MDRRIPGPAISFSPLNENDDEVPREIQQITRRQLNEDITAYKYDLDYCKGQITQPDISAQDKRNLQLRIMDLSHHIRHCKHRLEILELHRRNYSKRTAETEAKTPARKRLKTSPSPRFAAPKQEQLQTPPEDDDDEEEKESAPSEPSSNSTKQRLGFWECRLCTSAKYLAAGPGRVPSAPCKWPLKDIGKMISHHLNMHTEHTPDRRCRELGEALLRNLGPFEYWLCKTKGQGIGDGHVIIESVEELRKGRLPGVLRRLHKAAAGFPES